MVRAEQIMPYLDEQLSDVLGLEPMLTDDVTIRAMTREDFPALRALSPRDRKDPVQFFVYATLVAEVQGEIAGYTQFSLQPDGVLHSLAIRIGPEWKGKGIGQKLMDAKVALAKAAGAHMHFYAVAKDGEVALKKILENQGMHRCQDRGEYVIYVSAL